MLLIIPVFLVMMFISPDMLYITGIKIEELSKTEMYFAMFYVFLMSVTAYLGIYCFYIFRKTLRYFQQVKPFHMQVIQNFYKIGWLLSVIGITGGIVFFIGYIFLKHQIKVNLGFSPYLTLICLGLFFMVLSELFKVAKTAKDENELTI
jgi:uncharacterized membrane protein